MHRLSFQFRIRFHCVCKYNAFFLLSVAVVGDCVFESGDFVSFFSHLCV